jgi:ABC transport system ATP-binding/permease protein
MKWSRLLGHQPSRRGLTRLRLHPPMALTAQDEKGVFGLSVGLITLKSVCKDFGLKELLREANFSLDDGERVGLIGTNGSGKSTLLKILAGAEPIDRGERWVNPRTRVVYVPQEPVLDLELTVLEQVFADSGEKVQLVKEYEQVTRQLAQSTVDQSVALLHRMADLGQRMDALNAWELENQCKVILTQLGIEDFDARVGELSGGYRKRLALAAALVSEPDVLLLDEPTNHLDALAVEWLQDFLKRYRGALLLITHDRYFLDRVTNRILELDRGDLRRFDGNYSYYLTQKAEADLAAESSQRKFAGVLRRELEWLKRGPKARSTKQKARIQRIEGMQSSEFKAANGKVAIAAASRRLGKKAIRLENVYKSVGGCPAETGQAKRPLIDNFSYEFSPEDRVGIIGPNGIGKSTLLDLITGRQQPDSGLIEVGSTVHFGYFDQHADDLQRGIRDQQRVIDYLREVGEYLDVGEGERLSASQLLERFLFPPAQQYAPIAKLSGGEKRRLYLLRLLMAAPNVLLLDEPTNDLDVQTLAVLEEYLEDFSGCMIVVSHDRYFLDRTVDRIFAFEEGSLRHYPGNYSLYLEFRQRREAAAKASEPAAQPSVVAAPPDQLHPQPEKPSRTERPRRLSFKEQRELEQLEQQIPSWEVEKAALERQLYDNPPSGYSQLQTLSEQLAALEQRIAQGTERWLELSERAG